MRVPAGTGTDWADHEVPSHRSAAGASPDELLPVNPTAMQSLAETHDTPYRPLSPGPRATGLWMVQEVPFHTSASGTYGLGPVSPTATQELAVAQDTAASWLAWGVGSLGVGCTDHEVPFHRSARVRAVRGRRRCRRPRCTRWQRCR